MTPLHGVVLLVGACAGTAAFVLLAAAYFLTKPLEPVVDRCHSRLEHLGALARSTWP